MLNLSSRNISVAKEKAVQLGIDLDAYIHADVLDFDSQDTFDVVLLMGPLYHIIDEHKENDVLPSDFFTPELIESFSVETANAFARWMADSSIRTKIKM